MKYTVILLMNETRDRILLLKRNNPPYAHHLNGFGGKFEPGECPMDCAMRELWEETGLDCDLFPVTVLCNETTKLFFFFGVVPDNTVILPTREGKAIWMNISEFLCLPKTQVGNNGDLFPMVELAKKNV